MKSFLQKTAYELVLFNAFVEKIFGMNLKPNLRQMFSSRD